MAVREPLDTVRVQLEGRLEVVEQVLARWESAAAVLAADPHLVSDSWHGLPLADAEAASAIEALRAKAGEHELLAGLSRARTQVAFLVQARLASLGIACGADACAALELLQRLQPLTFGVLDTLPAEQPAESDRQPANRPAMFALLLITLIISLAVRQPALIVMAASVVALASSLRKAWRSRPTPSKPTLIVLTRNSLVVRDQTIKLNEVSNVVYRTLRGGAFEVQMHRVEQHAFRLIVHDPGQLLLSGLRQRGVKVSPRWPKASAAP